MHHAGRPACLTEGGGGFDDDYPMGVALETSEWTAALPLRPPNRAPPGKGPRMRLKISSSIRTPNDDPRRRHAASLLAMGKHSKNNNDRAFFSHAERQAAAYGRHSSGMLGGHNTAGGNFVDRGWGTQKRTLDSDSMKDLDACSLTLVPCVEPVITPKGIVYDKQVQRTAIDSPRLLLQCGLAQPPL